MTKFSKHVNIPLNRAEGDLEINVEINDGVITDAWSSGTMYRGFESMMIGRGALDGLVITPRICGICSLTHLTAAAEALDIISGVTPPDNARRLRNLALMVENIQSDIRQPVLMFMVDFANRQAYENHSLAQEAISRYEPMKGSSVMEVIRETKRLLEIVGIIGGQWPHTSFVVPGGVTSIPDASMLLKCAMILNHFQKWYERFILGCSLDRWQEVSSLKELDNWLDESETHRNSEIGFLVRFSREAKLETTGAGPGRFLSFGSLTLPEDTTVKGADGRLVAAGFTTTTEFEPFDQAKITEDISHSWFENKEQPDHPFNGRTNPYASGQGGEFYTWIKAPRYDTHVVETGPLAEEMVAGTSLYSDLIAHQGVSTLTRELARICRPAKLLPAMSTWIDELLKNWKGDFYHKVSTIPDGEGAGLIQAARGALGHWVKTKGDKITHYQIITPSAWNGSPRDESGNRGAWEEALVGTPIKDINNPVEAGHVIRSFDPCLVCAVHTIRNTKKMKILKI